MVLKLYLDYMSQPCRALDMFMKMSKIPFVVHPVALRKGEHRQDWFQKITPLRKVPVLQDDNFYLTESIAMVRYLAGSYPTEALYPKNLKLRAKIDEYLEWQHVNTRILSSKVFLIESLKMPLEPLETAVENMEKMLHQLETMFLKNKDFIAGDQLTVADIFAICELMQPTMSGRDIFEGHPKLREWFQRAKAATQPHFNEAHAIFNASAVRAQNKL
ncbi:glutathione S-transferase theta-1-like [Ciona intestinalis]